MLKYFDVGDRVEHKDGSIGTVSVSSRRIAFFPYWLNITVEWDDKTSNSYNPWWNGWKWCGAIQEIRLIPDP